MHYSLGALAFLIALSASAQDAAPVSLDFGSHDEETASHERAALKRAQASAVLGLRVRYVKVESRFGRSVTLPIKAGDILSEANLSAAMTTLRDAISRSESAIGLQSNGEVSVLYIAPKFDTSAKFDANGIAQPNDTVGVIFRPYYIDISLVQLGDNLLPIPRSAFPAFVDEIPKPLLVLNPTIGFSYDRAFGAAISAGVAPTLTDQLQLHAEGTKSLSEPFYRADGGLRYALHRDKDAWLRDVSVTANFDGVDEPLGNLEHRRRDDEGEVSGKFKLAPNTLLALDAGYRRSDDELRDTATTRASTNVQLGRAVLDTILPGANGFVRAAIWEDAAWQTGSGGAYQRFVGRVGYEKEVAIAPNQTIGVELLAGGGVAANGTPAFARFYGGNAPGQFLYDTIDATSLTQMPTGPLLRSFGENEAHLTSRDGRAGGTSFWHANLNLTFPIRAWSRPLIPNESVEGLTDANGNPLTLKEILKRQIDVTGPSMLSAVLKNEGLSDAEAQARAQQVLAEISPAAHFIIDDANVVALKPLLMFDAAGLSDGAGSNETWLAAGGGLQLTIVLAKFEAGYMHTISGPNFGHEGNAFVRLVFERLF